MNNSLSAFVPKLDLLKGNKFSFFEFCKMSGSRVVAIR